MTTRVTFVAISAGTFLLVAGCNNLPTDPERRARMSETTASCDVRSRATRFQRSVEPSCPNPATLHLVRCPAPGYIVALKSGTDATSVAPILAARYGFALRTVWTQQSLGFPPFYAIMSVQAVAQLRCEPSVDFIEENAFGSVGLQSPCG